MKRTPLKRKTPMKKIDPKRRARERERAYGPPERRRWIAGLPCSVPGCERTEIHNAHVKPEGRPTDGPSGMARKEDYQQIIPLCWWHHLQIHEIGQRAFNDWHSIDVDFVAVYIESRWQSEGANDV